VPPLCTVDVTPIGTLHVVRLVGEIDLSNVGQIESRLTTALHDVDVAVIDLSDLAYVDSSGLGMLERLARKVAVRLVVPDGAIVARTLHVTGLDQLVPTFGTREEAVNG